MNHLLIEHKEIQDTEKCMMRDTTACILETAFGNLCDFHGAKTKCLLKRQNDMKVTNMTVK